MRNLSQEARKAADQAVTEGVNLKYVERMRRVLYETADALAVAERERDEAREALRLIAARKVPRSARSIADAYRQVSDFAEAALAGGPQT